MSLRFKAIRLSASFIAVSSLSLFAQDVRVTATNPIVPTYGGRVGWGAKNNLLAFDAPDPSTGFYEIYTSNPDGSNKICLTCAATNIPKYNHGDPEWDATNQYLAIQVQWQNVGPNDPLFIAYTPGAGAGSDLYIMDAAGKNYWQVTHNAPGILHPRFSHDGTKLLWVQRTTANFWNLLVGDYAVVNGTPQVTNIQSLPPCAKNVFCETGGWSVDDSIVFFSSTKNQSSLNGLDIYSYNLKTGETLQLTDTPNNWDEFPFSYPNANKLIWMSGVNIGGTGNQLLQTDYWSMNYDGSNKTRLTFYNYQTAKGWYTGNGISCARMSWSPDGTKIAAHTIPNQVTVATAGTVTIIDVEPAAATLSAASFARPPLAAESIVASFYADLATSTDANDSTSVPFHLGGTTGTMTDSQGTQRLVPLYFASPNQINWQVPADTANGPATVEFQNSLGATVRSTVDVESVGPGIFSISGSGSGPAAGYLLLYHAGATTAASSTYTYTCSGTTCGAPALSLGGSTDVAYLVLYATGLRHAGSVTATVGGRSLPVQFAGAQPGFLGLDQVNVILPHSLAGSGMTDVKLTADGVDTNTVQVQIQ